MIYKNDLIFKIGTLSSFFLMGLDYFKQSIPTNYQIFLTSFFIIIIFIITLCIIYFIYSLFGEKKDLFVFLEIKNDKIGVKIINDTKYNIVVYSINNIYCQSPTVLSGTTDIIFVNYNIYKNNKNINIVYSFAESDRIRFETVRVGYFKRKKISKLIKKQNAKCNTK